VALRATGVMQLSAERLIEKQGELLETLPRDE
jgi:hypothetical protein